MTLSTLKAEALAQVDQLRRERDEVRKQVADLTKILLREGGVEGAYERRLAEALRERDALKLEVERLHFESRDVAERQRAACADRLHDLLAAKKATAVWVGADEIHATPLVTENLP